MKLEYGQAKMVTKVTRPTGDLQIGSGTPIMDNIVAATTWLGDVVNNTIKAACVDHVVEPGDKITITIEIAKEALNGSNGNRP